MVQRGLTCQVSHLVSKVIVILFESSYFGLNAVQCLFVDLGLPFQSSNAGSVRLSIQVDFLNGWNLDWFRSRPTKDAGPDRSGDPQNSKFSLFNLSLDVLFKGKLF